MTDTFFAADAETAKHDIVAELYNRLAEVKRTLAVRVPHQEDYVDGFEAGINCRAANEEFWLLNLLDKIERS